MDAKSEFYTVTYRQASLNIIQLIAFCMNFFCMKMKCKGNKCSSGSSPQSLSRGAHKSVWSDDRELSTNSVSILNVFVVASAVIPDDVYVILLCHLHTVLEK